jgi:hypothetical protein
MVMWNGAGLEATGSVGLVGWKRPEQFERSGGRFEEGPDEPQVIYPVRRILAAVGKICRRRCDFEAARAQSSVRFRQFPPVQMLPGQ